MKRLIVCKECNRILAYENIKTLGSKAGYWRKWFIGRENLNGYQGNEHFILKHEIPDWWYRDRVNFVICKRNK